MSPIRDKLRRGLVVIAVLAVLTAVEFGVALGLDQGRFAVLSLIAVVKAWLIVDYFMHVARAWHPEE
jgi:caa(3)-type oxidase subunit IV